MFIFCEECKEDICRIPWMFSYGYSCEEKHMMCVMFYCNLFSFISPFLAYDEYCKHSHVLHLALVGLFTSSLLWQLWENILILAPSSILHRLCSLFLPMGSSFPVHSLIFHFNYTFPPSQCRGRFCLSWAGLLQQAPSGEIFLGKTSYRTTALFSEGYIWLQLAALKPQ